MAGAVVLASALTHLHPGAGRSPGVVDLPVVRDPAGVFYIPGSAVKGALKTMLAAKCYCISGDKIDCSKQGGMQGQRCSCGALCCLLGGEVGQGQEGASALSVGDLYPLLIPVPSMTHGFLYMTSPMLVARAKELVDLAQSGGKGGGSQGLKDLVDWLGEGAGNAKAGPVLLASSGSGQASVAVGTAKLSAQIVAKRLQGQALNLLKDTNAVYDLHGLDGNTLVVPDNLLGLLIEKALVRLTRVRLSRSTKTVEGGALWTEEYIPQFTLFVGHIVDTGYRGSFCNNLNISDAVQKLQSMLGGNGFSLVIGGKESVGKGLLRARLIQ